MLHNHQGRTHRCNFAKAFDQVPHNKLLFKPCSIGITKDLWLWFKSYLTGRCQCVCINCSYPNHLPVLFGVPQGSILELLIFLIYINGLFSSVQFFHILSFANDTKYFKLIYKDQDTQQLQQDLESLPKWSEDWNLFFNTNKFIHLSSNTRFTSPQLHLVAYIKTLVLQFLPISHGTNTTIIYQLKV